MIDTVRFGLLGTWNSDPFVGPIKGHCDLGDYPYHCFEVFTNNRQKRRGSGAAEGEPQVFAVDRMLGMRIEGTREGPEWLEVSLPRLVYGSNGHLLTNDEEITRALGRLVYHLHQVARDARLIQLRRLDLCWQFEIDCGAYLRAASGLSWGLCRQTPMVYPGESVTWRGTGSSLCLYDKGLEAEREAGGPLRAEVRFKTKADCAVRGFRWAEDLAFSRCYAAYRAELLKVPTVRLVDQHTLRGSPTLPGYLAVLEQAGARLGDELAADWYLARVPDRTRRRLRAEMARQRGLGWVEVDWASRLPENGPPEAVHCPRVLAAC